MASLKKLAAGGVKFQAAGAQLNADLHKAFAFLDDDWKLEAAKRGIDAAAALKFYREQLQVDGGATTAETRK